MNFEEYKAYLNRRLKNRALLARMPRFVMKDNCFIDSNVCGMELFCIFAVDILK
jgi:hypothetical protein